MFVPRMVVGAALLVFGRKAFWLFVAGVGFAAGLSFATQVVHSESGWVVLGIAVVAGLLGALLAVALQGVEVGLAGFVGGGYAAMILVEALGWGERLWAAGPVLWWLVVSVGGVLGAVLFAVLFDWALIVLSSVIGGTLIAQSVSLDALGQIALFSVLAIIGIVCQTFWMRRESARHGAPPGRSIGSWQ